MDPNAPLLPPRTHISISYPSTFAPVATQPIAADGGDALAAPPGQTAPLTYLYACESAFRWEEGLEQLHALINGTLTLRVHDSATGAVIGSAPVDMLQFALGAQLIEVGDLQLVPAAGELPPNTAKVRMHAGMAC